MALTKDMLPLDFWSFRSQVPQQNPPDHDLLSRLGKNIARYIQLRGYKSQEDFAWTISVPKTTLSRIIRGKGDVRISKLVVIADALDVSIDALIRPKEPKSK